MSSWPNSNLPINVLVPKCSRNFVNFSIEMIYQGHRHAGVSWLKARRQLWGTGRRQSRDLLTSWKWLDQDGSCHQEQAELQDKEAWSHPGRAFGEQTWAYWPHTGWVWKRSRAFNSCQVRQFKNDWSHGTCRVIYALPNLQAPVGPSTRL